MWDRRVVEKIEECMDEFSIAVSFKNVEDQFYWAFASVYGPNANCDRRLLWDELAGLLSRWALPWCIGGISMSLALVVSDWVKLVFV
jgi:hypothetical protein